MPPGAPFDPCRQWLGFDAVELGNARVVLGLAAGNVDSAAVVRAAAARIGQLERLSPGPFELARAGLILRVEEARDRLLAELAAATPRPAVVGGESFVMPAAPAPRPADGLRPPASNAAPPPGTTHARPTAGGDENRANPVPVVIRTTVYRKRTPVAGVAMTLLSLAAVAAGLAFYTFRTRFMAAKKPPAIPGAARMGPAVGAERQPGRAAKRSISPDPPQSDPTPDRAVSMPAGGSSRDRRRPPRPAAADDAVAPLGGSSVAASPTPTPVVVGGPEPKPTDTPLPDEPAGTPAMQARAADAGAMMPAPAAGPAAIDGALAEALEAMRRGDHAAAERVLAVLDDENQDADTLRRVESWRQLAAYFRGFWRYRAEALAAVKPGDEYEVRNRKIAVIEAGEEVFRYRVAGENQSVDRDEIPGGIVLAILTAWFDDNPANHLYLGAYHLAKPESDAARAREHWHTAESAGIDASLLMPLLDDPAVTRADGRE